LPPDVPAVLLCALRHVRGIRPVVSLPDGATVRSRMLFAPIPDHILRIVGATGTGTQP